MSVTAIEIFAFELENEFPQMETALDHGQGESSACAWLSITWLEVPVFKVEWQPKSGFGLYQHHETGYADLPDALFEGEQAYVQAIKEVKRLLRHLPRQR